MPVRGSRNSRLNQPLPDPFGERPVMLRQPPVVAEDFGVFGQTAAHPVIARGRGLRHGRQVRRLAGGVGIQVEPVAQRPCNDMVAGRRGQEVHIGLERGESVLQHPDVSGVKIELVGQQEDRTAPPRIVPVVQTAVLVDIAPPGRRHGGGDVPRRGLGVPEVPQRLLIGVQRIEIVEVGLHDHRRVERPAHLLPRGFLAGNAVNGVQ